MRNAENIIDSMAQNLLDYLDKANEVQLMSGLKESITASVSKVMSNKYQSTKNYRHDRKVKYKSTHNRH